MPQDLPDGVLVDRWFAEPVKAVFLPTAIFLTNKAGYPVLPKGHQTVLRRFMQVPFPPCSVAPTLQHTRPRRLTQRGPMYIPLASQTVQHYVITGRTDRHRSAGAAQLYQQYIRHMWDTQPKVGASEEATRGYEDYLQAPLQVRAHAALPMHVHALLTGALRRRGIESAFAAAYGQPRVANVRGL